MSVEIRVENQYISLKLFVSSYLNCLAFLFPVEIEVYYIISYKY